MVQTTNKKYKYKIIMSGDEIELYSYSLKQERVIKNECEDLDEEQHVKLSNEEVEENSQKEQQVEEPNPNYVRSTQNVRSMKQKLRRLINANAFQYAEKDKFLTLTFEKDVDRTKLLLCFKRFNERLRYKFPELDYQYIAVVERGTKNTERLHMHCLFFGLPYLPNAELRAIWKYGYVKINAVDSFFDLANYITKYIEKTLYDGTYIPKGKRFYFPSRGLKKPEERLILTDDKLKEFIIENCLDKQVVFECEYESERLECQCRYTKFSKQRNVIPNFETEEEMIEYFDMLQRQQEFINCDEI